MPWQSRPASARVACCITFPPRKRCSKACCRGISRTWTPRCRGGSRAAPKRQRAAPTELAPRPQALARRGAARAGPRAARAASRAPGGRRRHAGRLRRQPGAHGRSAAPSTASCSMSLPSSRAVSSALRWCCSRPGAAARGAAAPLALHARGAYAARRSTAASGRPVRKHANDTERSRNPRPGWRCHRAARPAPWDPTSTARRRRPPPLHARARADEHRVGARARAARPDLEPRARHPGGLVDAVSLQGARCSSSARRSPTARRCRPRGDAAALPPRPTRRSAAALLLPAVDAHGQRRAPARAGRGLRRSRVAPSSSIYSMPRSA